MSSWDTSLCTVCVSPWPASFFYSPPSWLVFVAAKTHVQLFRMGKGYSHYSLLCNKAAVLKISVYFLRFWFFKFLILVGITVGAFFIPDGTFHNGTHMLQHFYSTFLRHTLCYWVKTSVFCSISQCGFTSELWDPSFSSWSSFFFSSILPTRGTRCGWKMLRIVTTNAGLQVHN